MLENKAASKVKAFVDAFGHEFHCSHSKQIIEKKLVEFFCNGQDRCINKKEFVRNGEIQLVNSYIN